MGGSPVRRGPQRTVDLDRQVRAVPVRAGHPSLREGRGRLAAGHLTAQGGGDPTADPGLHRLPADAERFGQRPQRPARLAQRGQRGRQQLAAPGGAQLAQPRRHALGQDQAP
jgi:hypothetical protein